MEDIYKLEVGKIKHQYVNKNLPGSFDDFFISSSNVHSHNTRRSRNNYFLPRYTSSLAIGSVRYQGVLVWESIPDNIKKCNYNLFIKQFRASRISKYNLHIV